MLPCSLTKYMFFYTVLLCSKNIHVLNKPKNIKQQHWQIFFFIFCIRSFLVSRSKLFILFLFHFKCNKKKIEWSPILFFSNWNCNNLLIWRTIYSLFYWCDVEKKKKIKKNMIYIIWAFWVHFLFRSIDVMVGWSCWSVKKNLLYFFSIWFL